MKFHFFASRNRAENVKKILHILKKLGQHVTVEVWETDKRSPQDADREKKSDAIIMEVSDESPLLGFRIAEALTEKKPILLLYQEDSAIKDLKSLVGGTIFRYLTILSYNPRTLPQVLKGYIESLKKEQEPAARFNFILSGDLEKFLNWLPFGKKVSKSDFIRDLIREAMAEDEEYKAFLKSKRKR